MKFSIVISVIALVLVGFAPFDAAPPAQPFETNLFTNGGSAASLSQILNEPGAPQISPEFDLNDFWDPRFGKNGFDGSVNTIAVNGSDIYVAGVSVCCLGNQPSISKWNGNKWTSFGVLNATGSVQALKFVGTDLYAGGTFSSIDGVPASNIAKWNGSAWSALGSGTSNTVYDMDVMGTDL